MTYEQYTGYASVNEHDKSIWNAAYIEGQKAMRQRVKDALDGADTISELIDVIVAIDDIPIEGE